MSKNSKVSIIIPVFNQMELTRECVESIRRAGGLYDLILVNNGSDGATSDYLRSVDGAEVVDLRANVGFAGGMNAGLATCIGQDVILLNNDTVVCPGWIDDLRNAAYTSPDIGLAAARSNAISQGTDQFIHATHGAPAEPGEGLERFVEGNRAREKGAVISTPYVAAFCVYVKARALGDVPRLSIEFGLGNGEDQDFVLQLLCKGWRSVVAMGSFVFHRRSQTLKTIGYGSAPDKVQNGSRISAILNQKWAGRGIASPVYQLAMKDAGTGGYLNLWLEISKSQPMIEGRAAAFRRRGKGMVSIIIPHYNQSQYLEECLRSATSQTYGNYEVIVVDDGSDGAHLGSARAVIGKFPSVLFIQKAKNAGLPAARNTAIHAANGDLILPLDADDRISPDCLELSVSAMAEGKADVVYGRCRCFGDASNLWNFEYSLDGLLEDSLFQCTALFARAHWKEVGGYNEQLIRGREDWDFWLRMAVHGHFGHRLPEVTFFYRKKTTSMLSDLRSAYEEVTDSIKKDFPKLFASAPVSRMTAERAIMADRTIPLPLRRKKIGELRRAAREIAPRRPAPPPIQKRPVKEQRPASLTIEARLRRRR